MDFTHSAVRFSLLIILQTSFVTGDANNCDCSTTLNMINSVRNIVMKDMFDLKLQNDLLTSRLDLLEQKLQETPQKPAPTISPETQENDLLYKVEKLTSSVESEIRQVLDASSQARRLSNLAAKAVKTEKRERLKTKSNMKEHMIKLQESMNNFTRYVNVTVKTHVQTITEKEKNLRQYVSDAVTELKEDSKIARNNMWMVLNETMLTDVTELQNELGIIRQDISKLSVDVSSVTDIAVLGEDAVCSPSCINGGVCFKDNTCRCKQLTQGERCEQFVCNSKCFVNGGECTGPDLCECPPRRSGRYCESVKVCELIPPINSGNIEYSEDRKVMSFAYFSCNDGYFLHPNSVRSNCSEEQKWEPKPPNCYNKELVHGFFLDGAFGSRLEYKRLPITLFRFRTTFTLEFKTKEFDGVLFYSGNPQVYDHMSVIIKEGHICLSFDCGTGTAKVQSKGIYADGQWHTLTIVRTGRVGMLQIDDEQSETVESGGHARSINGRPPYLFGGIDESQLNERMLQNLDGVMKSFKGCIANITLSGRDVGTPSNQFGTLPCPNDLFLSKTN